jgi:hypothetical protein
MLYSRFLDYQGVISADALIDKFDGFTLDGDYLTDLCEVSIVADVDACSVSLVAQTFVGGQVIRRSVAFYPDRFWVLNAIEKHIPLAFFEAEVV